MTDATPPATATTITTTAIPTMIQVRRRPESCAGASAVSTAAVPGARSGVVPGVFTDPDGASSSVMSRLFPFQGRVGCPHLASMHGGNGCKHHVRTQDAHFGP